MNLQTEVRRAVTEAAAAADDYHHGKVSEEGLCHLAAQLAEVLCNIMLCEPFDIYYRRPSGSVGFVGFHPEKGDSCISYLSADHGLVDICETGGLEFPQATPGDLVAFISDAPSILAQMGAGV